MVKRESEDFWGDTNVAATRECIYWHLVECEKYREVEYESVQRQGYVDVLSPGMFVFQEDFFERMDRIKERVDFAETVDVGTYKGIEIEFEVIPKGKQKKEVVSYILVFTNHKIED